MSASRDSARSAYFRGRLSQKTVLVPLLVIGFVVGVAYRAYVDEADSRDWENYLRSGVHGFGVALAGWAVQEWFARNARSSLGVALRRLPLLGELLIRSIVMALALVAVGFSLQFALYWRWLTETLPFIVAIGFLISLIVSVITGIGRLVGAPMLLSVVLGTYHRPARRQLIVMFLDIAGSTRLAEEMGELRVHDLITRFFFDIDEPISDNGGAFMPMSGTRSLLRGRSLRIERAMRDALAASSALRQKWRVCLRSMSGSSRHRRCFGRVFIAVLSLSANAATQSGNWLFSAIR